MKKTLLMLAFVAGFTCFARNAQAAIVIIDISPTGFNIGGTNGGVPDGDFASVANFPISGNSLNLLNNLSGIFSGLEGDFGLRIAAGPGFASPVNFALNALIDVNSSYTGNFDAQRGYFKAYRSSSPDFGSGSYMGFRTAQNNYGWLEVTWTASSGQFQILSGGYESTPDVAILAGAGAGPAAVPEPGTWAAAALLAGGAAFARWRKRRDETQKEAA